MRGRSDAELYIDANLFSFMANALRLVDQQTVFISELALAHALVSTGCAINGYEDEKVIQLRRHLAQPEQAERAMSSLGMTPEESESVLTVVKLNSGVDLSGLTEFYMHTAVDPREKYSSQGIVASSFMPQHDSFYKWFRRAIEIGLFLRVRMQFESLNVLTDHPLFTQLLGAPLPHLKHEVENCGSENIITQDSEFHPLGIVNYETLIHVCALMLLIAYMILLIEKYCDRGRVASVQIWGEQEKCDTSIYSSGSKKERLENDQIESLQNETD